MNVVAVAIQNRPPGNSADWLRNTDLLQLRNFFLPSPGHVYSSFDQR
jgi:hypothetical protein